MNLRNFKYAFFACSMVTSVVSLPALSAVQPLAPWYTFTKGKPFAVPFSFFSYFKETSRAVSIDSLRNDQGNFAFTRFSSPIPAMGSFSRAAWVKIRAENPGDEPVRAYLQFADVGIDELFFYHVRPDTTVSCTTGVIHPFYRRDVDDRDFSFHCVFPAKSVSTIFLRCSARLSIELPVSLLDEASFIRKKRSNHFISGLIYGILSFFGVAALYLSFIYRDANFRNFAIFILHFCIFLAVSDGIFYMYVWPKFPVLQNAAYNFFIAFSLIWGMLFCMRFFKAEGKYRWGMIAGYILIAADAAGLLYSFAGNPRVTGLLQYGLALATIVYAMVIAIVTFRHHDKASRFCFFAWSVFFLIITVRIGIYVFAIPTLPAMMEILHVGYNYHLGILAVVMITSIAMSYRLRSIEKQRLTALIETETLRRKTLELRLSTLQARVQPHFLFNTLNTIANCVATDPPKAEHAIIELSEFYRTTLRHASRSVSRLQDEIDLVKRYLFLEKMKFGDRLGFSFETDERVNDVALPSMSLQILVENSLKHGILPAIEGGSICVSTMLRDDACRIVVDDTGLGLSKKKSDSGTGLANLRARLELIYHGKYSLQILDKKESGNHEKTGVTAILQIPLKPAITNLPESI
jgi:hypothetical protein